MIADREPSPHEEESPYGLGGFGAVLREARQAQDLDIPAIANRLKIRSVYLRALEEEDIAALPARPFAIGFLRSYARLLKLNPDPLVTALKRRLDGPEAAPPPAEASAAAQAPAAPASVSSASLDAQSKGGERSATLLFSPLLFAAAALGLGFALSAGTSSDENRPRIAAAAADQTKHVSHRSDETAGPTAVLSGRERGRADPGQAEAPSTDSTVEKTAQGIPKSGKRHSVAPVAFRVRAGAWVLVKDARGRPLWSGMLAQGQLWAPPEGAVRMTTTHPGNLILLVDGIEKGALGVAAQPLLDIPLAKPTLLAFLAEQTRQSRLVRAAR